MPQLFCSGCGEEIKPGQAVARVETGLIWDEDRLREMPDFDSEHFHHRCKDRLRIHGADEFLLKWVQAFKLILDRLGTSPLQDDDLAVLCREMIGGAKKHGCRFCHNLEWRGKGIKAVGGCRLELKPDTCNTWELANVSPKPKVSKASDGLLAHRGG